MQWEKDTIIFLIIHIDEDDNSFCTELKPLHKKERYVNLKNLEISKAIARIIFSLHNLFILTRKSYKIKATQQVCIVWNQAAINNGLYFLLYYLNYEQIRKDKFGKINLKHEDKIITKEKRCISLKQTKKETKMKKQLFKSCFP